MKAFRDGRVFQLVFDNPERRNALSERTCRELLKALSEAWSDPGVGCVLLSGEGPVFCAGMDLDEATAPDAASRTALHEEVFTFGFEAPKPVVAAVQGAALGGGLGLVANAHVALAAQGTKFALSEIRLGMWPFVIWRAMTSAIGERRTLELALTGRVLGTTDALQLGLIHEITPPFELADRAEDLAAMIAEASPEAVHRGLDYVRRARTLDAAAAGALARNLRTEIFRGADFPEGVRAFREKRKPVWPSLRGDSDGQH
jgi:enoyl-CoA hydratase/carnithine racemase